MKMRSLRAPSPSPKLLRDPRVRVSLSPQEVARAPPRNPPLPGHSGMAVLWSGTMERQWVPLLLLLVPWLPGLHPCLLCFGPPVQWARLCREIARSSQKDSQHQHCLEALAEAAVPLAPVTVGSGQSEALRKIIMDALHLLEKQKDKKPLAVSLREAIQIIWVKLSQLEQAPACIPPCGECLSPVLPSPRPRIPLLPPETAKHLPPRAPAGRPRLPVCNLPPRRLPVPCRLPRCVSTGELSRQRSQFRTCGSTRTKPSRCTATCPSLCLPSCRLRGCLPRT
ncbi:uncharacterized protein LOC110407741 isoform X2 [Numida meleagris]|uniref:uncharacterized protein LOC110407741 isoform X2 n=1 Tax=Numida meleagris TaxID=8996 RepID=UPI000B3E3148|nr:uncharacterized protein LOC110407741 isoform X2 [Numida meleagris]